MLYYTPNNAANGISVKWSPFNTANVDHLELMWMSAGGTRRYRTTAATVPGNHEMTFSVSPQEHIVPADVVRLEVWYRDGTMSSIQGTAG
jgi:hypothetical protein